MCITYKKFCCCCCNVVTCSKVFAIFGLIGGILSVISEFLSLNSFLLREPTPAPLFFAVHLLLLFTIADRLGHVGIFVVSIVISVVWMIADACLLYGISKKKPGFMMVWLVIKMILLVVSC